TVPVAGSVSGGSPVVGSAPGGGSCPGPAGGAAVPVTQQRVLAALTAGHRRTKDIAAAAGMASSNTSTALRHLAAAGLARSTDRGRWEPVS
ncbi:MarR family transcriptional regulator, partial [Pseudonocardia sp. EV170527-09]